MIPVIHPLSLLAITVLGSLLLFLPSVLRVDLANVVDRIRNEGGPV